jgi:sugar phosphate isomerase/epimerase
MSILTSRRQFLAAAAAASQVAKAATKPVIGLELYSVREEFKNDYQTTLQHVAKMGYPGVEFYGPYYDWTVAQAKEVRALLDDLNLVCYSTHNSAKNFEPANIGHMIELNRILGSKFAIMASAGKVPDLDGWKRVADTLSASLTTMKGSRIYPGFHNHRIEFEAINGTRPMDVLAKNTPKDVVLQLDVGTCLHAGQDPVAWINANPGRIRSIHLKDWSSDPAKGYKVLFGEGSAPWKQIFAAAEKTGGVEHYLIEQEGSEHSPLDTVRKCLENFKRMRA